MKNKRIIIIAFMLIAVFGMINISAYASADEPAPVAAVPLTPQGNLSLVDDVKKGGNQEVEEKQFITVETKDGNTFYIIIDRAGDKENVYFLNKVDEADLMALIEDGGANNPGGGISAVPTPDPAPTPDPDPQPEQPKEKNGGSGTIIMILLLAAAGGGAYYYFKILKPKQANTAGNTSVDEFVFEDDEDEETITEDSNLDGGTEPEDGEE